MHFYANNKLNQSNDQYTHTNDIRKYHVKGKATEKIINERRIVDKNIQLQNSVEYSLTDRDECAACVVILLKEVIELVI